MIKRALMTLYFSSEDVLFHGVERNNPLSHFQHVSQNIWQQHHALVMRFG